VKGKLSQLSLASGLLMLMSTMRGQAQTGQGMQPSDADAAAVAEAARWIQAEPRFTAQYHYVMTCRIRLLFFWTRKDDVGGGYVKVGEALDDPRLEIIQLLFGSDPAKAHGINRWGAGTEVARLADDSSGRSSAFFGFMKSSEAQSASEMQRQLSDEKVAGKYFFQGIMSRVDPDHAISTTVPFYSDHDFNFEQLEPAEKVVMRRLATEPGRKLHVLQGRAEVKCARTSGFLSTLFELMQDSLNGKKAPLSLCYLYNANQYVATLESATPVRERAVHVSLGEGKQRIDQTYHDSQDARFRVENRRTQKSYPFEILLGTSGDLRGVPLQINYQPDWWFQVILNLKPPPELAAKR
jgi:hypothetical protein